MTFDSEERVPYSATAGDLGSVENRARRLETACLYLREFEPPSLDFELSATLERLFEAFGSYVNPDGTVFFAHTAEERAAEWRPLRTCLRRIDGRVFDKDVFEACARLEFNSFWTSASRSEREELATSWLLSATKEGKAGRLKFYVLNLAAITTEGTNFEAKTRGVVNTIAADDEAAFTLWEYSLALDDYGFSDEEDARDLCDKTIDFLRRHIPVPSVGEIVASARFASRSAASQPADAAPSPAAASADAVKKESNPSALSPTAPEEVPLPEPAEESDASEPSSAEPRETYSPDDDLDDESRLRGADDYYSVDEGLARAAQEANSFREYVPGSATREYRAAVDSARVVAARQKEKVDVRYHERIDRILDSYERQLAAWYDKYHRNAASCPSIMIAGAGNFPRKRHEKKVQRTGELLREHEKISELPGRIETVGFGGVSADDAKAVEKLESKLAGLKARHEEMKIANAYRRKHGSWDGYDGPLKDKVCKEGPEIYQFFNLPNSLAEIRRVEERIKYLKRLGESEYGDGWKFDGGVVKANKDDNRLQIFFTEKPEECVRTELRRRGFRWSPRLKTWQRMLTPDAICAAQAMGFIPKDWKPENPQNRR